MQARQAWTGEKIFINCMSHDVPQVFRVSARNNTTATNPRTCTRTHRPRLHCLQSPAEIFLKQEVSDSKELQSARSGLKLHIGKQDQAGAGFAQRRWACLQRSFVRCVVQCWPLYDQKLLSKTPRQCQLRGAHVCLQAQHLPCPSELGSCDSSREKPLPTAKIRNINLCFSAFAMFPGER